MKFKTTKILILLFIAAQIQGQDYTIGVSINAGMSKILNTSRPEYKTLTLPSGNFAIYSEFKNERISFGTSLLFFQLEGDVTNYESSVTIFAPPSFMTITVIPTILNERIHSSHLGIELYFKYIRNKFSINAGILPHKELYVSTNFNNESSDPNLPFSNSFTGKLWNTQGFYFGIRLGVEYRTTDKLKLRIDGIQTNYRSSYQVTAGVSYELFKLN